MRYANRSNPWRGEIRALESNIAKFRAMEMALVIHYAEEIKRTLVSAVEATRRLQKLARPQPENSDRPASYPKALRAWHELGCLDEDEAAEIRALVDYRNDVAHRVHLLSADLSPDRTLRDFTRGEGRPTYDYTAVDRMRAALSLLSDRAQEHGLIQEASFNFLLFETAEKALKLELKRLRRKITRLYDERIKAMESIQGELSRIRQHYRGEASPGHPLNQYDDGRLTPRGIEICYRLFEDHYSNAAIGAALGISIKSVQNRRHLWKAGGGESRSRQVIADLPKRKFYRRYED